MRFTTARGIRTLWSFTLNFLPGATLVQLCSRSPSCSVGATCIRTLCFACLQRVTMKPRQHGAVVSIVPSHRHPATPPSHRHLRRAAAAAPRGGGNEPGAACFLEAVMAEQPRVRPRRVLARAFQGLEPRTGTASTGDLSARAARASHGIAWRPRRPARSAPRAKRIRGLEREVQAKCNPNGH